MKNNNLVISRCVPLPKGYQLAVCTICGGVHLSGILVSEFADEQDPDIICKDCGKLINNILY